MIDVQLINNSPTFAMRMQVVRENRTKLLHISIIFIFLFDILNIVFDIDTIFFISASQTNEYIKIDQLQQKMRNNGKLTFLKSKPQIYLNLNHLIHLNRSNHQLQYLNCEYYRLWQLVALILSVEDFHQQEVHRLAIGAVLNTTLRCHYRMRH